MNRRKEREQAFILIFEKLFRKEDDLNDILEDALSSEMYSDNDYSKKVFFGVYENVSEIDEKIKKYLKGWKIERLSKVSLSLIRLSVYEITYLDDIPAGVSVNEAVELCKMYSSKEDASFVNGVLGSLIKDM